MIRYRWLVLGGALLFVAGGGCTTVSKQSPTMKAARAEFSVNAETMRIRTRSLGGPFTGYIEESADRILSETTDPEVSRQALVWKADGIPAVRAALFRPDPLIALLDTWALTEQLIDYFESGPGRERLGDWAYIARDASRDMRDHVIEVLEAMVAKEGLEKGEEFVGQWAAMNPITGSIAGRHSMLREAGMFKVKSGTGGLKIVGSLAVTLDDMLRQIEAYTANIPKQARWEAQLAVMEMVGPENVARSIETLPVLLDSAGALASTVEDLPGLVSHEREAVLNSLRRERIESLVFLRQERLETLAQLSAERVAVLEHAEQMRVAITDAMHAEVALVGELIQQQRAQTMEEAEGIAGRTLDGTFERMVDLVDHVFLRVLLILVWIFVGCILLVLLAWRLFRRPTSPAAV